MPLRPLILPAEVGQLARPCYADEALLTQIIAESEREDIRPRIGATLFVALKSTESDADLTGSLRVLLLGGEWTDNSGRMHYLDGIKVALAYYTYGRVIRDGNITSTRYGAVIKSDDNSNSASDNAERQRQYRQAFDTADTMIVEAVNYITAMKVGGYEDCPGIRSNRAKMSVIGNHSASCGCKSEHTTIISGKEGPSAYDVAVANGFRGSVEDWLASLVGPQGPEGPQGPQGSSVSLDDYYDKPEVDALLADKASASDVEAAISEEAAARENGDQSLGTQIAALENNVGESIRNVEDKVDGVSASLAVVQSDLETEQAARVAADAALGTRISNEESARKSSDDSLSESIAAEATKRGSEDSRIEGLIGIERNERAAADAALELSKQDAISDLETIRSNAQNASNTIASIVNAGYVFAGVATSSTNPGIPDAKVFYIANGKGTYTNFGGLEVTEDDVVVLYWDTAWHKVSTGIASQAKLSELDMRTEDIMIEVLSNESDGPDEIQFNNDDDTESYVKIGQYGIKAKGFYNIDGKPISISFSDGEDITLALEALISNGGDVYICGYGIAYIHKPIKISKSHTHIHVGSGATLKLTDSLIDSYTPGNPIWMFYTPGSLYYWDDSRVRTETLEDILIEGGTFDFNGYYKKLMTSGNILAEFVGISIVDVDSFVLRNCTLLAASSFCTMFAGLHGFHIYDCAIHTTGGSHDGIHFHGDIRNGIIENLTGETTGDDFVGLNTGGDFWKGWMEEANVVRKGDSFNITIRNLPKECNVRLLNGKTHTLSGVVLENVPKFSITCYGEDAYYKDITIRGRSVDNTYYVEASNYMSIIGGVDTYSHTIHIETLTIDSCLARNTGLMLLSNADIKNLVINGIQYYAEPTSGQLSHPDFTGLFPLIKTSNKYLQGDDFKATSVMGQSKVGRLYLNNCLVNDTRTLVNSAGVTYGVKIPSIINTDSIGKIFISNSDITVAKICVPDAQIIKNDSSIIDID